MPTSNCSLYITDRQHIAQALRGERPDFPAWYWALRLSRALSVPPWEIQEEFGLSLPRREWCERAEVALRAEEDFLAFPHSQTGTREPFPRGYLPLPLLPAPFTEPESEVPLPMGWRRAELDGHTVYQLAPPTTAPSAPAPTPDPNAHLMDCQYRRTIPRLP